MMDRSKRWGLRILPLVVIGLILSGCQTVRFNESNLAKVDVPRERSLYSMPDYIIETPDILLIDAVNVTPKPPYRIAPLDTLLVQVPGAFPSDPIAGVYPVEPGGTINLGLAYGTVSVSGLSINEARAAIEKHLRGILKENRAVVALGQSRALQQIRGPHIVTPDGKVRLGVYGSVVVTGLTVSQAKAAIESHLANYLQAPEISLDVQAYNSKVYYVIFDGAGNGKTITRLPVTGNDTVLDAMAQVGGLVAVSDEHKIWVARPGVPGCPKDQIMPVDLVAITTRGRPETNYQLFPGDRIYVQANSLVAIDTALGKFIAPFTRVFGFALLGRGTVAAFAQPLNNNNNNGGGNNNAIFVR